jgi:heme/copper-type cytochrome/quinol oxidase subunit 2
MPIVVKAVSQDEFAKWIDSQAKDSGSGDTNAQAEPQAAPTSGSVESSAAGARDGSEHVRTANRAGSMQSMEVASRATPVDVLK